MPEPIVFPWPEVIPALTLAAVAVLALVTSDFLDWRPGRYLFKPLAAIAFLWMAMTLGPMDSGYGKWLLAGLLLCALGDLLLMFEPEAAFLAGLIAFLSGHLLYMVAFAQLPTDLTGLALSLLPAAVLVAGCWRWLRPHLHGTMAVAVPAYILVIAGMLVLAGSTAGQQGATLVIAGAWGFALSDLAVARRQFMKVSRWNGVWGTPLYFGSQLLLAASIAYL